MAFLTEDDLHLDHEEIPYLVVRPRKTRRTSGQSGEPRELPLVPQAVEAFRRLLELGSDYRHPAMKTRWLFPGNFVNTKQDQPMHPEWFTKAFQRIGRAAGLSRFGPHQARHTMQTKLRQNQVTQEKAMELAGHSSKAVSDLYGMHRKLPTPRRLMHEILSSVPLLPPDSRRSR
jgi:integrase